MSQRPAPAISQSASVDPADVARFDRLGDLETRLTRGGATRAVAPSPTTRSSIVGRPRAKGFGPRAPPRRCPRR